MQDNKAYLVWIVLAVIGIVLLMISAFAGIDQLKKAEGEVEALSDLPVIDYADYSKTELGSLIAITGLLQPAKDLSRMDDLFVYFEQTWNVDYDDEDDWTGQWDTYAFSIPNFMLVLPSGSIAILEVERTIIDLPVHNVIVAEPRTGIIVNGITEGTVRQQGFKSNDLITVIGKKAKDGVIPDRISGGSCEDLLTHLAYRVSGLRIAALVFGIIGLILILIAARNLLRCT